MKHMNVKHEEHLENLVAEAKKLTFSLAKIGI